MNNKWILLSAIILSVITIEQTKADCPKGITHAEFEMYQEGGARGYPGWVLNVENHHEVINWLTEEGNLERFNELKIKIYVHGRPKSSDVAIILKKK